MLFERRTTREVLADNRGISASIPEALAGVVLKLIIIAGIAGALAAGFAFWAQSAASAETSSGFQNANIAFEKAVHEADVVTGTGSDRVGLLRDVAGGKCEVQTWQTGTREGKKTLQVDTVTRAGACSTSTPLHAAGSAADSKVFLFNIDTPAFAYANLGGRTITFDSKQAASLASGAKPDGVKSANWDDVRPYKVTMSLQTQNEDANASAKKAVSTGYTNVVAVTEADDDLRYVPTPSTNPIPGPVKITGITRSTSAGTTIAGTREGVAVSFTGAVCKDMPTKVTTSYTRQSPSTATPVSTVLQDSLNGSVKTVHLGSVPNGSVGGVVVTAVCVEGGAASTDSRDYAQKVPTPALTVTQGDAANKHVVSWTKVSSLPTSYTLTKAAAYGTENNAPVATTALTRTITYTEGMTFANKTDYSVRANVGSGDGPAVAGSITTPWPTVPSATGIAWKHTGANAADSKGALSWKYTTTCPAGTTLFGRVVENRTGQSNGTYSNTARATSPFTANRTSYTWDPSYALQGYSYGVGVDSYCDSDVTPFNSATKSTQSPNFTTPMARPAAPVWDAYNHREYVRGTDRTWSTCFYGWEQPVCPTMTIDYKTYCSPGSWVGWSSYTSTSPGATYSHTFGWKDYWHVAGLTTMPVTYKDAVYQCFTPWVDNAGADTPTNPRALTSPAGKSKAVTVWRVWPY